MSFQEDFSEFLDEQQGFAVLANVTTSTGATYEVKGIVVGDYFPIEAGLAGFTGDRISFECPYSTVENVEYGDMLTVSGAMYRIVEIKQDYTGWVVLGLEKQG